MGRRPLALLLALTLVVAACTSGADPVNSDDPGVASGSQPPVPTASSAPSAPPTPQQAALSAYEQYTVASVEALTAGTGDAVDFEGVAAGQALSHLRDRLRANARDGVAVTGDLTTSATVSDVRFDGERAKVTDCVLNGFEHVDADDPDEVVSEATGWRQPVVATVEQRGGDWVVTRVRVPLRDGSGRVPPPPDDPPYLRGPAQGPAPPSCVPPDLAEAAVDAYEGFRRAYDTALGIGRSGPADPDLPALEATAVDPQLSAARDFVSSLASKGQAFRGEPSSRDPWAVAALDSDESVFVYDCVTVGDNGVTDAASTAAPPPNAESGTLRLDGADVVATATGWRVASVSVIEEGLKECTSSG